MSATKLDQSGVFQPPAAANQTALTLPASAVRLSRNGVEFLSARPFPAWSEMTVDVVSPPGGKKIHATGVVVNCQGNRREGYVVSLMFMNLSRQALAQLARADSALA
ncbi:MAG: PilZ domain-containing protein [Verrucomicrobia bacterium]|nr:PilZ domain-containing protein [Verrucomicrobiota bacterium]